VSAVVAAKAPTAQDAKVCPEPGDQALERPRREAGQRPGSSGKVRSLRQVEELISDEDSWPSIQAAIDAGGVHCDVLPLDDPNLSCLFSLQVTTRSALGALAAHCGGLKIDHGWIRLYGAGHDGLPSLAAINGLPAREGPSPSMLLVGEDVLGGRFAINGGALGGELGEVNFWAPDTLEWTSLGGGHGDFVSWVLAGGSAELYECLRWPGWESDVDAVALHQGLMLYPPPCTSEGQDTSKAARRPVPRHELDHWLDSLAALPDGERVRVRIHP